MARILAISSQVVSGRVGLSAIAPALFRLGHEVLALPTILLSNHPGRQPAAGTRVDPTTLEQIVGTLHSNGLLANLDAILTGYLPSAAHVAVAADAIALCRAANPRLVVLCDPVIGDDPKGVYIDAAAARAQRERLVPAADILTPNRFELSWLTDLPVTGVETAITAARSLGRPLVVATSIPEGENRLATLAITTDTINRASVITRAAVPNGTGDLLAALFLSEYLAGSAAIPAALARAVTLVDHILAASEGHAELQLTADW